PVRPIPRLISGPTSAPFCDADGPKRVASRASRHGSGGSGGPKRCGPTGGRAKGRPRKTVRPPSAAPRTGPRRVSTRASMASILSFLMTTDGREYPRSIHLRDGAQVTLRLMTPADAASIASFARSLPEDDLLFLRMDITDPEAVAHWMRNLEAGLTTTVIAETGGAIAGYAALVQNRVGWQRHLGEIRTQVALPFRSQGLGRALAGEIFSLARGRGLRKIVAQMTPDQKGAMATFERLGFRPEALLQDFVVDRSGRTRDLVVMAFDVTGLTEHVDYPSVPSKNRLDPIPQPPRTP